jgi:enhancing lycopene biosynthesis protein 2
MSFRVGVLLSGCGYLDGSEIHESVLTLLHLDRAGAEAVCIAPRVHQRDVVDHATGKALAGQSRDVLQEAARIARGKVRDLGQVKASDLDALILPGGYGAAKNLSDFAVAGDKAKVLPQVQTLLREVHAAGKPIGAICISPAVVASVFGSEIRPTLTIGSDAGTARAIEAMGGVHKESPVTGVVVDDRNRIVSTPAYMCNARVSEVSSGIEKLVQKVLAMAGSGKAAAGAGS